MKGVVKFYNRTKGFGFIEVEGEKDFFVHSSGLDVSVKELYDGDKVVFDTEEDKKGLKAVNVKMDSEESDDSEDSE